MYSLVNVVQNKYLNSQYLKHLKTLLKNPLLIFPIKLVSFSRDLDEEISYLTMSNKKKTLFSHPTYPPFLTRTKVKIKTKRLIPRRLFSLHGHPFTYYLQSVRSVYLDNF